MTTLPLSDLHGRAEIERLINRAKVIHPKNIALPDPGIDPAKLNEAPCARYAACRAPATGLPKGIDALP